MGINVLIGNLAYAFGNYMHGDGKSKVSENRGHIDLAMTLIGVQRHWLYLSVLSDNC